MKRLTLIRHAKSSWDDPNLADLDRPLNKRGKRDAPMMGKRLAKRGEYPDLILSSPARRALKTAKAIAKELNYPPKKIMKDSRIYDGTTDDLIKLIRKISDNYDHLFLVGHNPDLNILSYRLSGYKVDNIPTCGVFCIDFDIESWKDVELGRGKFIYFDYPKNKR